ncbi:tRNA lysidine(34) synthetase TilS [Halobacillus locisalis]|uniref:tRNA(Ile)-lysidine synthase n=2 Tax=Halobacillus locisalis TaxID=220753 RepID=A0A838CZ21_9BACI|nr:tRNA lysidine(34) synthetase TilS [Halobacillus locisalis]
MDQVVHSFMTKHQLIDRHQTVIVAVSGGPDSMALLHLMNKAKEKWAIRLIAVSVDHGLRGEDSAEDFAYVKRTCEEWGIKFVGTTVDVASYKKEKALGTQEAARHLRYEFLAKQMNDFAADVLMTGHHGDDQIETMMMQMVRNVRPEAVRGIPVSRPFATGRLVRPLLCVSKSEIQAYNSQYLIAPRTDPSNEDTEYRRNAFRKHVIPFVKGENPKLHQHMQAMSERVREDQSYIKKQAEEVLGIVQFSKELRKSAQFSIETFKTFPLALQRSAFHLILNYLYINNTEDISYLHEEMFFSFLNETKPNAELHFPRGLTIVRAYDDMMLSFQQEDFNTAFHQPLPIGETIELPNGDLLSAEWSEECKSEGSHVFVCDSHHVKLPLAVRTRRNGDRMRVRGMNGSKKVKDIFIDQKVSARARDRWPIVIDSRGEILWLVGLKKGGECTVGEPGLWLRLHYENKADT